MTPTATAPVTRPIADKPATNGHTSTNGHANANSQLGFATRAIHVGSEPSGDTGAVIPAISLSTTFAQSGVGNFKGYEYSRSGNPNRDSFERAVASLEGAKHGLAFSSGSAVTATILSALAPGSHLVSVNDVYGGTYRYFTKVASVAQNVETTFVEMDGEGVEERVRKAVRPDTKLLWLETPTNPTLRLVDIAAVSQIAKEVSPEIRVVVDNTFMSPWFQSPLSLGADIVVHSVTKYINGHSDVVMGIAVTNDEAWASKLKFLQNSIGAVPSAFDSWLALRGLKTLPVRMRAHGASALRVAQFLEAHPAVDSVIYPGLPSHPNNALAARQIADRARTSAVGTGEAFAYGGMVTFRLKTDPSDERPADALLERLRVFTLAESLGGVESLIEQPSRMTHAAVSPEDRLKLGIGHNLIRASVGLEDVDDLIADLDQAISGALSA